MSRNRRSARVGGPIQWTLTAQTRRNLEPMDSLHRVRSVWERGAVGSNPATPTSLKLTDIVDSLGLPGPVAGLPKIAERAQISQNLTPSW